MSPTIMPLTLAGPYCDLGNFTDVIHKHKELSKMSISISADFSHLESYLKRPSQPFVNLAVPRTRFSGRWGYYSSRTDVKLPSDGQMKVRLTFMKDEPFGPSLSRVEIEADNIGTASFVRTTSGERVRHWRAYSTGLPPKAFRLVGLGRSFFPSIEARASSYRRSNARDRRGVRTFGAGSERLFGFIDSTLGRSEFIGPFRTPPERRYAFAGFSSNRSDPSGARSVDLLITESLLAPPESRPLNEATSFWIRHLKLAENLNVRDIAKRLNLFELDVTGAHRATKSNLVDVGFGISQVLPVIVQGLLMRPGGIYLVQQPEIHLHPDAQAGLADFFIYLASYGVITVVETHSEYLLLRLRRRLAEGGIPLSLGLPIEQYKVPPLSREDVTVLLTGSDKGGNAFVTELEIGDSFQFENLPKGFMSQAMDDRIELLNLIGKQSV
jgi:hypothetical protein